MRAAVQIDDSVGVNVLIDDVDGAVVLENLKRRWHISGARHAGLKAFCFRIGRSAIGEILLLRGNRLGTIWDLAIRRIDDYVGAFEAGVRVVLCHPDATQVRGAEAALATRSSEEERQERDRT